MRRVYLAGPPEIDDEYVEAKRRLEVAGWYVLCNPVEEPNLRLAIAELTTCDAICLMDVWWSDVVATQLQTIAAWLRLEHVDTHGDRIPTTSLRG